MRTEHWHQKLKLMHKQKKHWEANKVKLWPEFFWQTPNTTTSSYHSPGYTSPNFLAFFTNLQKNKTASGTFSQRNQSRLPLKGLLHNRVIRAIFRLPQLLLHSINIQKLAQLLPQQQSVLWCMNRLHGCRQDLHYDWSHYLLFFAPFI